MMRVEIPSWPTGTESPSVPPELMQTSALVAGADALNRPAAVRQRETAALRAPEHRSVEPKSS